MVSAVVVDHPVALWVAFIVHVCVCVCMYQRGACVSSNMWCVCMSHDHNNNHDNHGDRLMHDHRGRPGARVTKVAAKSLAETNGIKVGAVIFMVGDEKVCHVQALFLECSMCLLAASCVCDDAFMTVTHGSWMAEMHQSW